MKELFHNLQFFSHDSFCRSVFSWLARLLCVTVSRSFGLFPVKLSVKLLHTANVPAMKKLINRNERGKGLHVYVHLRVGTKRTRCHAVELVVRRHRNAVFAQQRRGCRPTVVLESNVLVTSVILGLTVSLELREFPASD